MTKGKHKTKYTILHDFQVKHLHVLQLDSDYEYGNYNNAKAVLEGKSYSYMLNSVRAWVVIEGAGILPEDYFKGKIVEFVNEKEIEDKYSVAV